MYVSSDVQTHNQIKQARMQFFLNIQGRKSDCLILCKNLIVEKEA